MKIEITELIVRVPHRVSMETARIINDRIRAVLKLPDDVPVLILDGGMSVEAVSA